jgi:hypothetical protein
LVLFLKLASLAAAVWLETPKNPAPWLSTPKEMIGDVGSESFKSFDHGVTTTASPQKEDIFTAYEGSLFAAGIR